jgi:hypothetical protein
LTTGLSERRLAITRNPPRASGVAVKLIRDYKSNNIADHEAKKH